MFYTLIVCTMAESALPLDQETEIKRLFEAYSTAEEHHEPVVDSENLEDLLEACEHYLSHSQLKSLKLKVVRQHGGRIHLSEYLSLLEELFMEDVGSSYKQALEHPSGILQVDGATSGIKHSFVDSERIAFTEWINSELGGDPHLTGHLPMNPLEHGSLSNAVKDGILLCRLVNWAVPGTIEEKKINQGKLNLYTIYENQTLVLEGARAVGCNIVNIGAGDLNEGRLHLVMGLIWQLIRIGLAKQVDVKSLGSEHILAAPGESAADVSNLSLEQTVQRWVNYNLKAIGHETKISNFSTDLMDSKVYSVLLHKLAPADADIALPSTVLAEENLFRRAEIVLSNAKKLNCSSFLSPADIVHGNQKLNLTFLCNILNKFPEVEPTEKEPPVTIPCADQCTSTSDIELSASKSLVLEEGIKALPEDDGLERLDYNVLTRDSVFEEDDSNLQDISICKSNEEDVTTIMERQTISSENMKEFSKEDMTTVEHEEVMEASGVTVYWVLDLFEQGMDWMFRAQHPLLYFVIIHGIYVTAKLKSLRW